MNWANDPGMDVRGHDVPQHERLLHQATLDCRCGPVVQGGFDGSIDGETIMWFAVHRRFDRIVPGEVLT